MTHSSRKREPLRMLVVALCTAISLNSCEGLCPALLTSSVKVSPSSLSMARSSIGGKDDVQGASIARARQRDREAKTLYDYLGANPKDTQEQLKIRYTTLAKALHPDSNPDRDVENSYYDLSEINAAWEVLKDPMERKRYDRSLQTKEITEGIESLVTKGLESFATTAIPFLQKTAVTTAAAVQKTASTTAAAMDASTKAAKEVNEQATKAYGAFEIEQQIKMLEQKSKTESMKALKLEKELVALPTQKIATLEKKQSRQQQLLSSVEAQRILNTFQATATAMKPPPTTLSNDIKLLTDTEANQKEAIKACQSAERATQMAVRKVEQAQSAEEMAQKRLEEAQKALKDAKMTHLAAQDAKKKASNEERMALQSSTKIETQLQKARDKVRTGLLQQQDAFLGSRANELKKEKLECEKSSNEYMKEAKALRIKAKKEKQK